MTRASCDIVSHVSSLSSAVANISCISTDRKHFGCNVPGLVVSGPAIRMKRRRKLSKEELRDHYIDLMIAAILREDWVGRHRQSNLFCFSNPCGILCHLMCIRLVFSNMRQSAACSSSQLCLVLYSCVVEAMSLPLWLSE